MDPGELNADKVPRRYDGMKPENGNKSYMDGRTRGPARFSGAAVAPAVTPKMCQRQQTLNTVPGCAAAPPAAACRGSCSRPPLTPPVGPRRAH